MKEVILRLFTAGLVILIIYLFLSIIHPGFIAFEYADSTTKENLLNEEKEIAQAVSKFLWIERSSDVVILSFLLFITLICCIVILRPEGKVRR